MTLIDCRVGFWAPRIRRGGGLVETIFSVVEGLGFPRAEDFIDPTWDPKERKIVLRYVTSRKFRGVSYMGYSECRLCDKHDNGTADFSDKTYIWPEGFGHYIEQHFVRPPDHFVEHVLKRARR